MLCVVCVVCVVWCVRVSWKLSCSVLDPQVLTGFAYKIYYIDHLVEGFMKNFNRYYADALATDFNSLSLTEQADYVKLLYRVQWIAPLPPLYLPYPLFLSPPHLSLLSSPPLPSPPLSLSHPSSSPSQEVLGRWEVPIYNDTYVMLFFGLLKKLVSKWLTTDANEVSKTVDSSGREKCTAHSDT